MLKTSKINSSWSFDVSYVNMAAVSVYGYALIVPLVLLSRISFFGPEEIPDEEKLGLQMYSKTAEYVMCSILPGSPTKTTKMTDGGMLWVDEWNSLQYSIATTFLVVIYSDYMLTSKTPTLYCSGKLYNATDLRNFSISQVEYLLGNNPLSMSYLIGYGDNNPQYIHHRGSSILLNATTGCTDGFMWLNSTDPNPNVAVGAMVGGPFFMLLALVLVHFKFCSLASVGRYFWMIWLVLY